MDNKKNKIVFQATPTGVLHFLTTMLIILTIVGFVFAKQTGFFYFTAVLSFLSMFRDETSIFLYQDRFVIRYSNYLGKLMATDLIFNYKDVNKFEFEIDRWTAGTTQTIFVSLINILIPGHQNSPLTKAPKAKVTINFTDPMGQRFIQVINFSYRGHLYSKALGQIKEKANGT